MSAPAAFWKRVHGYFSRNDGLRRNSGAPPVTSAAIVERAPSSGDSGGWTPLPRPGSSQRMSEVLDALASHFERQERRSEALSASVERVASILERLADTQRQQNERIARMADEVGAASAQTARLTDAMSQLPASLLAQADSVRGIAAQIESATATDAQLVVSLQRFGDAVDTLRVSGSQQVETLQRLQEQQQRAAQSVQQQQNRRFGVMLAVVATVSLLAIGGLVAALMVALGR